MKPQKKWIIISLIASLLILLIALLYQPTSGKEKPAILDIFDQFLLSHHAANSCLKPDPKTMENFFENFHSVWFRSAEKIQELHPEYSQEDIGMLMENRSDYQEQRVKDIVKAEGCKDERIQDLLKRFDIQAGLKFDN